MKGPGGGSDADSQVGRRPNDDDAAQREATMSLKSQIYRMLRVSNDFRALKKGRIGRRIGRRLLGRVTGRGMKKLFR